MDKKWKWQPFTPKVRANAQAVINELTGATLEIVFSAGIEVGKVVKYGGNICDSIPDIIIMKWIILFTAM